MQEKEIKKIIPGRDVHKKILHYLGSPVRRLEQTNLYLDTGRRQLLAQGIMVRVRRENAAVLLTVKRRMQIQAGYFVADNLERRMQDALFEDVLARGLPLSEVAPPLQRIIAEGIKPETLIRVQCRMDNIRLCFDKGALGLWEVDHTKFPDGSEDFELEVETERPELVQDAIARMADALQIRMPNQTRTKYQRLLAHLKPSR